MSLLRFVLMTALLLGCLCEMQSVSAQQPSAVEETGPPAAVKTVGVDDVASDAAISTRLRRIFESSGYFTDLEVESDSGIVTLRGIADNDEHRQWATSVTQRTQDVIAAINKLEISSTVDISSSRELVQQSLGALWTEFLVRSPLLVAALIVILITILLAKFTGWLLVKVLGGRGIRLSLQDLIHQLSSLAIWIVGILTATVVAFPGMTPSKALTVLGLGSVAIGFAFKDIFENFFAGMLILWKYPFDRGDFIECEGLTGKVEKITIRNTLIRGLDGELSVIPNATLFKNNVDVLTSQPQRRVRIICGVAYGEDVDAAREVIRNAMQDCETILGVRTIEVFAQEFASSSINFEVVWWTGSKPTDIRRSRDEVIAAIKRGLDSAGIEIPFPYRTLTFQDASIAAAIGSKVTGAEHRSPDA
ncbi:mechanosensitive ion channel family protein [Planctomycetes bacterium Poly21]|uniref:Small-conductance mechanosensitive channel n=1 Tax=Allorhodopirellula heiligendammensis TaxID=2714739 RepID=A0A5C6BW27_9BACT|nr:Small-conductance mechanosensitive channel [Allorhodopirellula heiligendammensis]